MVTASRSRATGRGSRGQRSAMHMGGHPGTAHRAGTVHRAAAAAQRDARGWHGPWGAGLGAGSRARAARAGWGVQRADAGCYNRSICWLLVFLLFNFFFF